MSVRLLLMVARLSRVCVDFCHPFFANQFDGDEEGQALAPQVCTKLFRTPRYAMFLGNPHEWGRLGWVW